MYYILLYSILLNYIRLSCFIVLYFIVFYSIEFYFFELCFIEFYILLFNSVVYPAVLFHTIEFHPILLNSIRFYSTQVAQFNYRYITLTDVRSLKIFPLAYTENLLRFSSLSSPTMKWNSLEVDCVAGDGNTTCFVLSRDNCV